MIFGPLKPEAQSSIGSRCDRLKTALQLTMELANCEIRSDEVSRFDNWRLSVQRQILLVVPGQFTTNDNPFQCVVVSMESNANRHNFKMTFEPKASDFLQRDTSSSPAAGGGRFRLSSKPGAFGYLGFGTAILCLDARRTDCGNGHSQIWDGLPR